MEAVVAQICQISLQILKDCHAYGGKNDYAEDSHELWRGIQRHNKTSPHGIRPAGSG